MVSHSLACGAWPWPVQPPIRLAATLLLGLNLLGSHLIASAVTFDDALKTAEEQSLLLAASRASVQGNAAARAAAGQLPDPELKMGIDNLPVSGPDAGHWARDSMTMRRLGWMQAVPNAGRRAAQVDAAEAQWRQATAMAEIERLKIRRDVALAWLKSHFAQRQLDEFAAVETEHQLLVRTMEARIASGKALPADAAMARQQTIELQDRRDELQLQRDKSLLLLERWLGAADQGGPQGDPPPWIHGEPSAAPPDGAKFQTGTPVWMPLLMVADAEIATAQAQVRESQASKGIDWSWEVGYGKRASQYGDMLSFQLSFTLPTSPGTRQEPLILQKAQELERLTAQREDAARRLSSLARIQQAEVAQARRAWLRQREHTVPLVQERTRLLTASYEAGRADLGSVLTARREAADAALRAVELEGNLAQVQASLKFFAGE